MNNDRRLHNKKNKDNMEMNDTEMSDATPIKSQVSSSLTTKDQEAIKFEEAERIGNKTTMSRKDLNERGNYINANAYTRNTAIEQSESGIPLERQLKEAEEKIKEREIELDNVKEKLERARKDHKAELDNIRVKCNTEIDRVKMGLSRIIKEREMELNCTKIDYDQALKDMGANIRELRDESQRLRNTLAMSLGSHQSWEIASISDEFIKVKNRIKSVTLKQPNGHGLRYLGIFSKLLFEVALETMNNGIINIFKSLGFEDFQLVLNDSNSQENRNTLASRTKLFLKSVLQVNYASIETSLVKKVVEETLNKSQSEIPAEAEEIKKSLSVVGMDEGRTQLLATFVTKLALLDPPVRYRFTPCEGFEETCLIGSILKDADPSIEDLKLYVFPAIEQYSTRECRWMETSIKLTFID